MLPVIVRSLSARATRGTLVVGNLRLSCALGRTGLSAMKREGDGATPMGRLRPRFVYCRRGLVPRPTSALPLVPLKRDDGWCDDPADRNYNRPVRHPYPGSAERMWREDRLYDIVIVLGHNDVPRCRGRGSAIFIHIARDGHAPTEGCIALSARDIAKLVRRIDRRAAVVIGAALAPLPASRLRAVSRPGQKWARYLSRSGPKS